MPPDRHPSAEAGAPVGSCPGCGWEGGEEECRRRFDEVLARDFSDARFFKSHRLTVDTYCLQHPDAFCASAKSMAAHLVGLCWILEENASPAVGAHQLHEWLNGNRELTKPALPQCRGRIRIGDLPRDDDPLAWARAVRQWAEATWQAYSELHPVARGWLASARTHG